MVKGFEKITADLNEYERTELLPIIVKCLKRHIGAENTIASTKICERMRQYGYKIGGVRLRKIVNYIRVKGLVPCLVASGNGYYVATTAEEVDDYIHSLDGRIDAMKAVRDSLQEQLQTMK